MKEKLEHKEEKNNDSAKEKKYEQEKENVIQEKKNKWNVQKLKK